jgi:hypothetical protein
MADLRRRLGSRMGMSGRERFGVYGRSLRGYAWRVNSLETDVEVGVDGSLRLLSPLPEWLKPGRAHVVLTVREEGAVKGKRVIPNATAEMLAKRVAALEGLRASGGLGDVIPDPMTWQREIREDVVLPGRE